MPHKQRRVTQARLFLRYRRTNSDTSDDGYYERQRRRNVAEILARLQKHRLERHQLLVEAPLQAPLQALTQEFVNLPPRRSYHDRQWAAKMKEVGLQPTDTGEPGGKETGQSVTHYIVPGGTYAMAYAMLGGWCGRD